MVEKYHRLPGLMFVLTALRWIGRGAVGMMRAIPMVWRTLGIICVFELVNLVFSINMADTPSAVLLWFIWQGMAALGIVSLRLSDEKAERGRPSDVQRKLRAKSGYEKNAL